MTWRVEVPAGRTIPVGALPRVARRLLARVAPRRRIVLADGDRRVGWPAAAFRHGPDPWQRLDARPSDGDDGDVVDATGAQGEAIVAAELVRGGGARLVVVRGPLPGIRAGDAPLLDLGDAASAEAVDELRSSIARREPTPVPGDADGPDLPPGARLAVSAADSPFVQHLYPVERFPRVAPRRPGLTNAAHLGLSALGWRGTDAFHLQWPEHLLGGDPGAHRRLARLLSRLDVPVVWTVHNLVPHDGDRGLEAIWARAATAVVHLSAHGESIVRSRLTFRDDAAHHVALAGQYRLPHGPLPSRAAWRRALGVPADATVAVLSGAPRPSRCADAAAVSDRLAASGVHVLDLSGCAGPTRVGVTSHPYRTVPAFTYLGRLTACDAVLMPFAPPHQLATASVGEALGLGLPGVGTAWPFLEEYLGDALVRIDESVESAAHRLLTEGDDLRRAARAAAARRSWVDGRQPTLDLIARGR